MDEIERVAIREAGNESDDAGVTVTLDRVGAVLAALTGAEQAAAEQWAAGR